MPVLINSTKTSLLLDAHTNLAIGHPSSLAIYPAKILPKLPQGTTKLTLSFKFITLSLTNLI